MKKIDEELIDAAQKGELNDVKKLIEQGADVTAYDNNAIRWAAANGRLDTVKYLVSQGADYTVKKNEAIQWATQNRHPKTVRYLISQGARIDRITIWACNTKLEKQEMLNYINKLKEQLELSKSLLEKAEIIMSKDVHELSLPKIKL